jgi:hypothetical protein
MAMFITNAPAAKFAHLGDAVEGTIVDAYRTQRYEYVRGGQGQPLYWSNKKPTAGARVNAETGRANDPVLQWVLVLDTGQPDEQGDTERRLFVKNQRMEKALTAAVTVAGGRRVGGLLLGGYLRCTWVGEEDGDGPQPAKVYAFEYAAPPAGTGREPSGEVRLAEREPEPAARVTVAGHDVTGYLAGSAPVGIAREAPTYADRLAVGEPSREVLDGAGAAKYTPPSREALATARSGVRDTDVSAGVGGRPRPADDDEPPF